MKRTITLFLCLLSLISNCNCQKIDTIYYDKNWNETNYNNCKYYRIASQHSDIVKVVDYYKNGQIQMTGAFKSFDFEEETGPFYYYKKNKLTIFELYEPSRYPELLLSLKNTLERIPPQPDSLHLSISYYKNRKIESMGYFSDCCIRNGIWVYYSKNGKEEVVESFRNNLADGLLIVYRLNKLWSTIDYKDGKRDGEWRFYDKNEKVTKIIKYRNGEKIKVPDTF